LCVASPPEDLNDPDKRFSWKDQFIEYAPAQIPKGAFGPSGSKDELPMAWIWPNGPCGLALKIKVSGCDSTDTESMAEAEIRGRRELARVLDYYQRVEKRPWVLDHCSPIIGIREGRRVVGDYVLTVADVRAGREFADGVARGTWYLDLHSPDNNKRTYDVAPEDMGVPPYQIPLRSLIARDGVNLLMAGRCLSADQLAQSSARVAPTGAMMGQAAGIAAALAAGGDGSVRDVPATEVRRLLLERGANLDVAAPDETTAS
jgi:FAD-dependent oxidoreductase family protein